MKLKTGDSAALYLLIGVLLGAALAHNLHDEPEQQAEVKTIETYQSRVYDHELGKTWVISVQEAEQ